MDKKLLKKLPGYDPFASAGECEFDDKRAAFALRFFEEGLTHTKGVLAGKAFELRPWQRSIVANLFGWIRPDGTRRYREAFILVPRKNGKTTLAAGIALYMLLADGEKGAEVYCAAADREQALLVFGSAEHMIRGNDEFMRHAKIYTAAKSIVLEANASSFKAISSESKSKHGYNSHCIVIDELHAQNDRDLVDVLVTSTGARSQPLILHITTADFDRPSICNEKRRYALQVRDGAINDPAFLPVIYEASQEDDWTSPKVWAKSNPNLGVSISREYMARECKRAQESSAYQNTFKRLHLNVTTQSEVKWLDLRVWDRCRVEGASDLIGRPCWLGLDLSSTRDLTAMVAVFPDDDGSFAVEPWFWCPRITADSRHRTDRIPYQDWIGTGDIQATDGNVVDYDMILEHIYKFAEDHEVREVAVDRWNSTHLITKLQGQGLNPVPFGQGFASMSGPTKELEKLILAGKIRHDGNEVLRWMVSNTTVNQDAAGNLKPDKQKSSEKIDGVVALIMALGRAMIGEGMGRSVYDDRRLVTL